MCDKKILTISDLEKKQFKKFGLQGTWLEHIGDAEETGSWIIYGASGHGKTSYTMQLTKELCKYRKVLYNTLEEGNRESFKQVVTRNNMKSVKGNFGYLQLSYDEFMAWKTKNKSRRPHITIIDSLQYFFRNKTINHYAKMLKQFPNDLFIFISHASGSLPKGKLANDILFHSDLKIEVKDFMAVVYTSRFKGGGNSYVIWKEGAEERLNKLTR